MRLAKDVRASDSASDKTRSARDDTLDRATDEMHPATAANISATGQKHPADVRFGATDRKQSSKGVRIIEPEPECEGQMQETATHGSQAPMHWTKAEHGKSSAMRTCLRKVHETATHDSQAPMHGAAEEERNYARAPPGIRPVVRPSTTLSSSSA